LCSCLFLLCSLMVDFLLPLAAAAIYLVDKTLRQEYVCALSFFCSAPCYSPPACTLYSAPYLLLYVVHFASSYSLPDVCCTLYVIRCALRDFAICLCCALCALLFTFYYPCTLYSATCCYATLRVCMHLHVMIVLIYATDTLTYWYILTLSHTQMHLYVRTLTPNMFTPYVHSLLLVREPTFTCDYAFDPICSLRAKK
jgi:hypothetical protein